MTSACKGAATLPWFSACYTSIQEESKSPNRPAIVRQEKNPSGVLPSLNWRTHTPTDVIPTDATSSSSDHTTMADDTRQSQQSQPPTPVPSEAPNAADVLRTPPRAPANSMPGGTAHTAGGEKVGDGPTYFDAVRSLGWDYYLNFHKRPCVRDGQMTGIASGFVAGSIAAILKRTCLPSLRVCVSRILNKAY